MIHTCEQGSEEWRAVRLGKVTASRVADVIAKTKSGPAASRINYMAELICQRLTGIIEEGFTNAAMQWGTEKEPDARAAYCWRENTDVAMIGFADHPLIAMSGASPDGLVGGSGLIEVKCPNTATHIETLLSGSIPEKYITQMQWQMACLDRAWCDFVSFDPRLNESLRLFVVRVPRDPVKIKELENAVSTFNSELAEKLLKLETLAA